MTFSPPSSCGGLTSMIMLFGSRSITARELGSPGTAGIRDQDDVITE